MGALLHDKGTLVLPGQPLTSPSSSSSAPFVSASASVAANGKEYRPGKGTHIHNGAICASVAGTLTITSPSPRVSTAANAAAAASSLSSNESAVAAAAGGDTISVEKRIDATPVLPAVNSVILGKVVRTTPRQATLSILCSSSSSPSLLAAGSTTTSSNSSTIANVGAGVGSGAGAGAGDTTYQALIRTQDVRATQKDQIKMSDSFRPGDIVRAEVISLGDQANFYASTAKNHLGVIIAYPEDAATGVSGNTGGGAGGGAAKGNRMRPVNWETMRDERTGREEKRKVAKP